MRRSPNCKVVMGSNAQDSKRSSSLCLADQLALLTVKEKPPTVCEGVENEERLTYIIEVYDFSAALKTQDIMDEFNKNYGPSDFRLKWVDDTHAIGLFATSKQAWLAAKAPYRKFKTRLLKDGTPQSKQMAEKLADKLRPTPTDAHQKPRTSAVVARRMVAGALGVRVKVSKEQQEKERRELQAARERRRQEKQVKN